MKNLYWVLAALLVLVAIGISALVVSITTQRTLSPVESILWQVFVLTAGLTGSFIFGQQSAQKAAREIIKPHARKAFRRLVSLYRSLSRTANAIKFARDDKSPENHRATLDKLEAIVTEQLATADDALEDWNDIVPEDVEELKRNLQSNDTRENE